MIEAEARFPDRLRELRRQAGLSQRELGGAIGEVDGGPVTGSAVGEWERGLSRPDRKKAFALDGSSVNPRAPSPTCSASEPSTSTTRRDSPSSKIASTGSRQRLPVLSGLAGAEPFEHLLHPVRSLFQLSEPLRGFRLVHSSPLTPVS